MTHYLFIILKYFQIKVVNYDLKILKYILKRYLVSSQKTIQVLKSSHSTTHKMIIT